jgi:hypothetical protein
MYMAILGYGMDNWGIVVEFLVGARNKYLLQSFQTEPETHTASYSKGTEVFSPEVKWPGREDSHLPTSTWD